MRVLETGVPPAVTFRIPVRAGTLTGCSPTLCAGPQAAEHWLPWAQWRNSVRHVRGLAVARDYAHRADSGHRAARHHQLGPDDRTKPTGKAPPATGGAER